MIASGISLAESLVFNRARFVVISTKFHWIYRNLGSGFIHNPCAGKNFINAAEKERNMTRVIMFPGQSSQQRGMGEELFDRYREKLKQAEDIIRFDIKDVCLNGTDELLARTDVRQIIIFVVNALAYCDWQRRHGTPDMVLGHSIGQYNAMVAAGMMCFETGVHLVKKRGEHMLLQSDGAMAAVMKISEAQLRATLVRYSYADRVAIANCNSEYQNVISTSAALFDEVAERLRNSGALISPIKTRGAFHSPYMAIPRSKFLPVLANVYFKMPRLRVLCNTTGEDIRNPNCALAEHLVSTVKWKQSIYSILEDEPKAQFYECGNGKTLSNLLHYNVQEFHSRISQRSDVYALDEAG